MVIGVATSIDSAGYVPKAPSFVDRIQFTGDTAYPTGGTAGFKASLQKVTKDLRTPFAVLGQDCGGYVPVYDEANDKLKVFWCAGNGAPMSEVTNATNLGAVTFNIVVFSH